MVKFKEQDGGLVCPWCPPNPNGEAIFILQCMHNPFELMKKIQELEDKLHRNSATKIINDLRIWVNNYDRQCRY